MKKNLFKALMLVLILTLSIGILAACNPDDPDPIDNGGNGNGNGNEEPEARYYVAGSFNGYEAKHEDYELQPVEDKEGWYSITVELTEALQDPNYNVHFYQITDGTWANPYGVNKYALQPAPVYPVEPGEDPVGLGSIYIANNMTLTILFDSNDKVVYDNSMVKTFEKPIIYGDFNEAMDRGSNWSTATGDVLELSTDKGEGVYEGTFTIPAYTGDGDGYSMAVAIAQQYYINEWGNYWGIIEQYKFDGTAAGTGNVSILNPTEDTTYLFSYDSTTKVTTVTVVTD